MTKNTITITTKIRLYPTLEQETLLKNTMISYVQACNMISPWVKNNTTITQKKINSALYHEVRETTGLNSQMAQSAIKTVIGTYKTIHKTQPLWSIEPVFKKHRAELLRGKNYTLKKNNHISLSTNQGRVIVPYTHDPGLSLTTGKLGTATLLHKHGKWMLHIPVTLDIEELDIHGVESVVGIDMGIRFIATTYDSQGKTVFYPGGEVKNKRAHYKMLRSELQSRGTRSARKRLRSIGSRENRWMTDVNHQVSKALVGNTDRPTLFVMEDLTGVRSVTEKVRKKDRYTQVSWAFHQLRVMIEYKARLAGHGSVVVDPKNTSRSCPKCGYTDKKNRDSRKHLFTCLSCSYRSNDDRVGAMNVYGKGIQYRVHSTGSSASSSGVLSTTPGCSDRTGSDTSLLKAEETGSRYTAGQGQTPTSVGGGS